MSSNESEDNLESLIYEIRNLVLDLNQNTHWLDKFAHSKTRASDFEEFIYDKLRKNLQLNDCIHIDYKEQSKRFPDIIIRKNEIGIFGIEIKTEKKSGGKNIMGGSIKESTRDIEFKKIYLIYLNIKEEKVYFAKYIDVVAGVQITHQPRYILNISLASDEEKEHRFFGLTENQVEYQDPNKLTKHQYNKLKEEYLRKSGKDQAIRNTGVIKFLKYLSDKNDPESINKRIINKRIFNFIAESYPEYINSKKNGKYNVLFKIILDKFGYIVDRDIISSGGKNKKNRLYVYCVSNIVELDSYCQKSDFPNFMIRLLSYLESVGCKMNDISFSTWKNKIIEGQKDRDKNLVEIVLSHFFDQFKQGKKLMDLIS